MIGVVGKLVFKNKRIVQYYLLDNPLLSLNVRPKETFMMAATTTTWIMFDSKLYMKYYYICFLDWLWEIELHEVKMFINGS
jgi:hypothetical protein